ncbi:protein CWC15 [Cryptococcus neoformans c45]|nr:protein CWC15 [Cryptococcus neoformans var. grubii c45]
MSQAHRPTWNPAQGRETKAGSQQISKLSLAAHTKLKFRQPGQTNTSDVVRRDLKAELLAAERAAMDKKRKAEGLPPLAPLESQRDGQLRIEGVRDGEEDEAAAKRRKILEEAAEMDKDDESESDEEEGKGKGKGKAENDEDEDDDDDDSDDESDDEDDTAALMAELAKIKQERAEEKARLDAEAASSAAISREAEIATGNPLMNLQAALGTPSDTPRSTTSSASTFTVKRRWDDDLIFKNQAVGIDDKPKRGEFVNDLLRSEFHKKFMNRFIK